MKIGQLIERLRDRNGLRHFGEIRKFPAAAQRLDEEHACLHAAALNAGGSSDSAPGPRPRIGDRLSVIPNHVCPTVNLHDRVWFHRKGEVLGSWAVAARGCNR